MLDQHRARWRAVRSCAVALAVLSLAACASNRELAAGDDAYNANDPLEDVNRAIFDFNLFVDDYILVPTAKAYRTVLPQPVQDGIRNFFQNLRSPIVFVNDVLQAEPERAGQTLGRFLVNTTAGIGGLFDVATLWGIPYHSEDFGQTFAVWGIGEGPYVMLPLLGPSTVRDAVGTAAGFYADPLNLYLDSEGYGYLAYVRSAIEAVDARSRNIELFDKIRSTSLDYYATIRSLYRQRRGADIRNEDSTAPTANPMSSSLPGAPAASDGHP